LGLSILNSSKLTQIIKGDLLKQALTIMPITSSKLEAVHLPIDKAYPHRNLIGHIATNIKIEKSYIRKKMRWNSSEGSHYT
jgi:hypothetical protein